MTIYYSHFDDELFIYSDADGYFIDSQGCFYRRCRVEVNVLIRHDKIVRIGKL